MNLSKFMSRAALGVGLGCCCLMPFFNAGADDNVPIPKIIQDGFNMWAKQRNASWAFDTWRLGGLLERDSKTMTLSRYFAGLDRTVGNYKSYEPVDTKRISQNSEVIYLSVNFEHAAIYARFLLYHTDKDWVVQNMDFSPRPEAVMPWLAFQGVNYSE